MDGDAARLNGWHADGLGIRGFDERRHRDRRTQPRPSGERRRGDRRRAGLRTLVLTAAALSAPHSVQVKALQWPRTIASRMVGAIEGPGTNVSVSIQSFDAKPARHAYDDIINDAAARYHLDPAMIKAVMQTESAFNAMAVSPVGALGLMQLMPEVARELGAEDPLDPRENIMAGAKYLRQLLDSHRGNVKLALASYNAGPGAVAKYARVPPFKETRNYVKRVTQLLNEAHSNPD